MKGMYQIAGLKAAARIFKMSLLTFAIIAATGVSADAADLGVIEPRTLSRNQAAWVVLDARPLGDWQAGHVPGARSFSWEQYTRTDAKGVKYKIQSPNELAKALGAMGIDEKTPIVVYGDADKSWGGEGWTCWALAWLGHKGQIRLLSGGIQAWRGQELPVVAGPERSALQAKQYHATQQAQLDVSTAELERLGSSVTLIDTRGTMEWILGKIPGAVHIPWEKFYTGKDRKPIATAALKKLLRDHDVPLDRPVVYYCLGGIRSGYTWMVHTMAGLPQARSYEGGYEEWKKLAAK